MTGLAAAAFMSTPARASPDGTIWVQAFDAGLHPTRAASWSAGGTIAGEVRMLPGGEIAAWVEPRAGAARIVRWDPGGKELGRIEPGLRGKPGALRERRDGSYLAVTSAELAVVGARDGRVTARRALGEVATGARAIAAYEAGAWFAHVDSVSDSPLRGRLVHAPLEGREAARALPVMEPPLERCRKEYGDGKECPWTASFEGILAIGEGRCLVAEGLTFYHDAKGPNRTTQVVLTVLDREGKTLAQRTLGDVESSLEWFWTERSPGNLSVLPGKMGLVRRRYDGFTHFNGASERSGGDLLALLSRSGGRLTRMSASLDERWSRFVQPGSSPALSPAWVRGLFLYSGGNFVEALDEQGGSQRTEPFRPAAYEPPAMRNAVGQAASGEWLLVSY